MLQPIDELLNHAPCGFLSFNDDGLIVLINSTLLQVLGYEAESLLEKTIEVILPIASRIFYQTHFFPLLKMQSKVEEIYFSLKTKQGNDIPMLINAVRRRQGQDYINDCIFIPIRQRIQYEDEILKAKKVAEAATLAQKQAETALRQQYDREILLREITQQIRQSLDLSKIFEVSAQKIRQSIYADRVGIFKFDPASDFNAGVFVSESVIDGFDSAIAIRVHDHCFGGQETALYAQRCIQVIDDINLAGLTECHKDILQRFQVQASLVVPLLDGEHLWGLLCIYQCTSPRHWQVSEIELIQLIANQLAIAIQQASLFDQLNQELIERQQIEAKLTESNQKLALSNEELIRATKLKDEFLANMSHELRTPLNAILGMTEGLQDQVFGAVTEHQIKALQTIERSGIHLLRLINDILDVAKIESGQVVLELTATSIANLCQSSMTFIKQQALQKRIQLIDKIPPNLPDLPLDERRICQVLINLLSNAVKFTQEGGSIILEVSIHATEQGDANYLRITITDTGIGISEENIQRLFQPFIQIDSALNRQYVGTGLGLFLTRNIVEMHGGEVSLTSKIGKGSCFIVDLPYDNYSPTCFPSSSDPIANTEPSPHEKLEPILAPLILLADDNEANIITISSYLEAKGYHLLIARNGQEAIALAKDHHPALILMDIQMPVIDGLEAIRQICLDPKLANIPIIALTALAMAADRDRCLASGATEYLSKPVKLKELLQIIQTLLVPQKR